MRLVARFVFSFALLGVPARAQVVLHDPGGEALIVRNAKVETLASGLKFTEGPVWLDKEQKIIFSDIPVSVLLQWTAADGVVEFAKSEQSNGNVLDRQGRLISCQHLARNLVRREPDGGITVLVDSYDGRLLNSPNDVAVHDDGSLWFTDPTYGLGKRDKEQDGNLVYRFDPTSRAITIVQSDFDQPNGICFSPDQERLYVADSGKKQRIGAFPVRKDCTLGLAAWWTDGGADGMRCDERGNLWATARDGVRVYSAEGVHLVTVPMPEVPTNCTFGGEHGTTLFVTCRSRLCRVELKVSGAKLPEVTAPAAGPAKSGGEPGR